MWPSGGQHGMASGQSAIGALALLTLTLLACGSSGVVPVNDPSTGESSGSSGAAYFKAKCKSDIGNCLADAKSQCGGEFTVVHKESHAGGLLADAIPGPVTWHTVTFRCGASAEATADSAHDDALRAFVMPQCTADWEGRCGLLTDRLDTGATIDAPALAIEAASPGEPGGLLRSAAKKCNEQPDAMTDECRAAFRRSFIKLLRNRYPSASDSRLHTWCEDHPAECQPSRPEILRVLERDFLVAHDRVVHAAYKAAVEAAARKGRSDVAQSMDQGQRASEEDRMRQTRAQMVQQAVDSMSQSRGGEGRTTMCPDGSYVTGTRCRLMPNGKYVGQ